VVVNEEMMPETGLVNAVLPSVLSSNLLRNRKYIWLTKTIQKLSSGTNGGNN